MVFSGVFFWACLVCVLSFFLVSCRFLSVLVVLEQMNCVLLLGSLLVGFPCEGSLFVSLLVVFTVEAVVGLCILVRLWVCGSLVGEGWW